MYLILPLTEGQQRNRAEATARGCKWKDAKAWEEIVLEDEVLLCVGDGKADKELRGGLTESETDSCVSKVPKRFLDSCKLPT